MTKTATDSTRTRPVSNGVKTTIMFKTDKKLKEAAQKIARKKNRELVWVELMMGAYGAQIIRVRTNLFVHEPPISCYIDASVSFIWMAEFVVI